MSWCKGCDTRADCAAAITGCLRRCDERDEYDAGIELTAERLGPAGFDRSPEDMEERQRTSKRRILNGRAREQGAA